MDDQKIRERLLESYKFLLKTGEGEGPLDTIFELLGKHPNCSDIFVDMFLKEKDRLNREILAEVIIYAIPYEPAVDFLRTEMHWSEDDFDGYPGYEKIKHTKHS